MHTRHIKGKYSWVKHFDFMLLDLLSLVVAFVFAYFIKFHNFGFIDDTGWREILTIACMMDIVIIMFTSPFSGIFRRFGSEELIKSGLQAIYNYILMGILLYVLKLGSIYSRVVILLTYVLYCIFSFVIKNFWKKVLKSGKGIAIGNTEKSIFVVGERKDMPTLLRSINSGFFKEYSVKGLCMVDGEVGEKVVARIDNLNVYGKVEETYLEFECTSKIEDIANYVLQNHIDEVFIGVKPSLIGKEIYQELVANGKGIHLNIKPMIGFDTDDQFITTVGTYKTLSVGVYSFTGKQLVYLVVKRFLDIIWGMCGLIALLPLMITIKLSYLATGDKKSIFYSQTRVGLNGETFKLLKFRSMVHNADEVLKELLKDEKYQKEWAENQKFENDPRITKMGGFLRKTSLDEIPQFINVLKGDMSLIGPRPLVVGELEAHNGLQLYNQVKPGITGWWGCNGRSNTTYDERLELEYYYVKNCSFYIDVLCIVKTIAAILKRDGAV